MFRWIYQVLEEKERSFRKSFGRDISNPAERRKSRWHYEWLDHGILRRRWHNFQQFAPGAYRSNHPNEKRFETYAGMGIKAVLNLRGAARQPHYLFEVETCAALGLDLVDVKMTARGAPSINALTTLLEAFDTIERPFLMHCKSGADRTGLAAAIYLMVHEGASLDVAKKQLSFRFLHIRRTSTGILDHFLDTYETRLSKGYISIVDWIMKEYDPQALKRSFDEKQKSLRFWQGWR